MTPARKALAIIAGVALLAAGVAAAVTVLLPGGVTRPATAQPTVTIRKAHKAGAIPEFDKRLVFLAIGSDMGAPKFGRGGSVTGGRADSIHLVVLDPGKRDGIVIGIPRDSYVPIPGHGRRKINAAMSLGGPGLLVRTVEDLSGMQVDYYALTSFDGLIDLVDKIGGVSVEVDMNLNDPYAGANLDKGRQKLNGGQALAYSRARKTVPGGDFTRSGHQGDVLIGGLRTFREQIAKDPTKVVSWLAWAGDEVDTDISYPEMFRLALLAKEIPAHQVRNVVLPGSGGTAGGASVVFLSPAADGIFARVRAGNLN